MNLRSAFKSIITNIDISYIYFYLILILVYLKNQKIIDLFKPILLILSWYYRKILYKLKDNCIIKFIIIKNIFSYFKTVVKFWTMLFEHYILSKETRPVRYSTSFVVEECREKCIAWRSNSHWKLMNSNHL